MIQSFLESPLLLLFSVIAIGYALGNVSIFKAKLGVAAVLFVGLGFGAMDKNLAVPEIIITLGLAIFVYTIGLSSGPGFFQTFKKRGLKDVLYFLIVLLIFTILTLLAKYTLNFNTATAAGIISGLLTSTASLAALLDIIDSSSSNGTEEALSNAAVVGYSLAYPMGVMGAMLAMSVFKKLLKIDYAQEEKALEDDYPVKAEIRHETIAFTKPEVEGLKLRDIFRKFEGKLVFGRMSRGAEQFLPNMETDLKMGDQIIVVGNEKIIEQATHQLGVKLNTSLEFDRTIYDVRRVFVSNPELAGASIASLNMSEKFSALITRVQQGDIETLATGETVLELGDRVMIVARRSDYEEIKNLFGNSYEAQSKVNLFSFGLGMALGLLIGMIEISLPGGVNFNLGFAGGPLVVALILGSLRKTGPLVWTLPHNANLTLRQIGLIFLLAGIGIRSGHTFKEVLLSYDGLMIFLAGGLICFIGTGISILLGYKFFKIPYTYLMGLLSSQPAILDFATEKAGNKIPAIGFTLILPIALILKIILVQLLYLILG